MIRGEMSFSLSETLPLGFDAYKPASSTPVHRGQDAERSYRHAIVEWLHSLFFGAVKKSTLQNAEIFIGPNREIKLVFPAHFEAETESWVEPSSQISFPCLLELIGSHVTHQEFRCLFPHIEGMIVRPALYRHVVNEDCWIMGQIEIEEFDGRTILYIMRVWVDGGDADLADALRATTLAIMTQELEPYMALGKLEDAVLGPGEEVSSEE